MGPDWHRVREEFPALANWTFLDTASFGQLPHCATNAVARHFAHRDETACHDFLSWFDDMDQVRTLAAKLIQADPDDIAFMPNASAALSLFLGGIRFQPGDRIVTFENEFPNNIYYPSLLQQQGVELVETNWDGFEATLSGRTRAVLVSMLNYSTGFRPPLEEMGRLLRQRGILFYVDGTQGLGPLPFNVQAVQPDMLAVHAYKWLLSPNGAAFAYVSPALRRQVMPNVIGWRSDRGWRGVNALNHGAPEFVEAAEKYEGGMLNFSGLYAMGASLKLLLDVGPAAIETRVLSLAAETCAMLQGCGASILHENSPIIAARFPGREAADLADHLKRRRILVSARHGSLRISLHLYNSEQDIHTLRQALQQ
ncbi:MAG TPA: aminotransferase class V-fold PLP-dependent enzyme [Bryobacteraceae bacterium]|nr:aminotransferase class V-fold PLP-dependent enzyme [Bryobacteraceae bacterium]